MISKLSTVVSLLVLGSVPVVAQHGGMMRSHAPVVAAPAGASVAPSPAANPASAEMKKAVARVNGVVITEFDLQEQMQRLFPYYQMHGGKVPEKYQTEIRKRAIDELVSDELVYQDAKKKGMTVSPAMMLKVTKSATQRLGSRKAYEEYAKSAYGSVAEFERRLRRARLIAEYEHREIELKAKVTDQKLHDIYVKNPSMFVVPETVRFQTISIVLPPEASDAQKKLARKKMDEILPQARAAAKTFNDFGLLAERVSEDDYRVKMGDHNFVPTPNIPEQLAKPIAGLKAGQLSDVIETTLGFMVVRVEARTPQKTLSYAEVRNPIRQQMETMIAKKRWQDLNQQLHKTAHIEVL